MADPGNGRNGSIVGAVSRFSQSVVGALPPSFLLLILINVLFMGFVLWFLADQMDTRTALAGKIIDHCLDVAGKH